NKIRYCILWCINLLALSVLLISCNKAAVKNLSVCSPNKKIQIHLYEKEGRLTYSVEWNGISAISSSELSIFPNQNVTVSEISIKSEENTWLPVWVDKPGKLTHLRRIKVTMANGLPRFDLSLG